MTKEALKLALEALEANHFLIHGSETKGGLAFCMDGYYSGCFDIDSNDKQTNKAITAIKEALAQPEHEPVAYLCENAVGHKYFRWKKPSSTYKPIALYTTPPQRTWVSLTDEEIYAIDFQMGSVKGVSKILHAFSRIIEAKLKEKNT
jgi:hypothetical protein